MKPTERQASAKIPGRGPRPRATTNINAKIISWVDRERTINARPKGKVINMLGVVVVAARYDIGIDNITANSVPQKAISVVSNRGPAISGMNLRFGKKLKRVSKTSLMELILFQSVPKTIRWADIPRIITRIIPYAM